LRRGREAPLLVAGGQQPIDAGIDREAQPTAAQVHDTLQREQRPERHEHENHNRMARDESGEELHGPSGPAGPALATLGELGLREQAIRKVHVELDLLEAELGLALVREWRNRPCAAPCCPFPRRKEPTAPSAPCHRLPEGSMQHDASLRSTCDTMRS
jgi:hypothetical protein